MLFDVSLRNLPIFHSMTTPETEIANLDPPMSFDSLLGDLEDALNERITKNLSKVNNGRVITSLALLFALFVPIATWAVTFSHADDSAVEDGIVTFAFSSIPLCGIFVLTAVTILRRRRHLEDQMNGIEDQLFALRKLRILASASLLPELEAYRQVVLSRSLAGPVLGVGLGKEEEEIGSSVGVLGSLVKLMSDSKPK